MPKETPSEGALFAKGDYAQLKDDLPAEVLNAASPQLKPGIRYRVGRVHKGRGKGETTVWLESEDGSPMPIAQKYLNRAKN